MKRSLLRVAAYGGPVIAAVLYARLILEAKYQEGWFDAQGCRQAAGCTLGHFSYVEFGTFGALVAACFILVSFGHVKIGNGLALIVGLLAAMAWVGMMR